MQRKLFVQIKEYVNASVGESHVTRLYYKGRYMGKCKHGAYLGSVSKKNNLLF